MGPYEDELTAAMQREQEQQKVLSRFKSNVRGLKNSINDKSEENSLDRLDSKYKQIVFKSFAGRAASKNVLSPTDDAMFMHGRNNSHLIQN